MKPNPKESKVTFQTEVDRLLVKLNELTPDSEEYVKIVKSLDVLCTARAQKANDAPSIDTLLMVGANIVGLLLVLNYEQAHILTGKAMSFILKGRS